jgi:5-formyltetrahydrofolate cyclo-ligase
MHKGEFREYFKKLRALQSDKDWKERSERICQIFLSSEFYQKSQKIAFFYYINKEVNLCSAIDRALKEKEVYLPCTHLDTKTLSFHKFFDFSELVKGAFGILEPPKENPVLLPEALDLILVPGLAFDRKMGRLGYGGGFYDRFLAKTKALKIGVAFSFQIVDQLPQDPLDQKVDLILTEEGFFR